MIESRLAATIRGILRSQSASKTASSESISIAVNCSILLSISDSVINFGLLLQLMANNIAATANIDNMVFFMCNQVYPDNYRESLSLKCFFAVYVPAFANGMPEKNE